VLQMPDGEIDVRTPLKPVRFAGETRIVSRLESGSVEVVNLIGERAKVQIDLQVLQAGASLDRGAGTHIVYAASGQAALTIDREPHRLPADHALRIETSRSTMIACTDGVLLLGSVVCV
jgi:environmental stress-induced protein Ves